MTDELDQLIADAERCKQECNDQWDAHLARLRAISAPVVRARDSQSPAREKPQPLTSSVPPIDKSPGSFTPAHQAFGLAGFRYSPRTVTRICAKHSTSNGGWAFQRTVGGAWWVITAAFHEFVDALRRGEAKF